MSNQRKIDRFFEDDINNGNNKVYIISFFYTNEYRDYIANREEYILNCENQAINSPSNNSKIIPLKQESEYDNLSLIELLLLHNIKDYVELYAFLSTFEKNKQEDVKDILESLFKKGLISFKITKQEYLEIKIDSYYSDFFK